MKELFINYVNFDKIVVACWKAKCGVLNLYCNKK